MEKNSPVVRDVTLGVIITILGAAIWAFAGIPTRVSVLETQFTNIDKKLDQIIDSGRKWGKP